ncbi:hypothetical protein SK128_022499 [Halocaridina rubra]|uniref:Uncharacterized protein n=1 Tax=Halocaridina rubra TaxID=373956 RepID=A0AAN8WSM4_HALRR
MKTTSNVRSRNKNKFSYATPFRRCSPNSPVNTRSPESEILILDNNNINNMSTPVFEEVRLK